MAKGHWDGGGSYKKCKFPSPASHFLTQKVKVLHTQDEFLIFPSAVVQGNFCQEI